MGRTWDDEGGPMVEPEPTGVEARVRAVLGRLDAVTARVLEAQGRHVSARLAAARTHEEQITDGYQEAVGESVKHRVPPARGATPRVRWRDLEDARRWPTRADSVRQAHEERARAEAQRQARLAALANPHPEDRYESSDDTTQTASGDHEQVQHT